MRDVTFRARRMDDTVHNGSWVYGHYFVAPLTEENSGLPSESGWFFLGGGEEKHCIECRGLVFVVDPDTVSQFTGLKDKCGVDIYEGDIIKVPCDVNQETHGNHALHEVVNVRGTWVCSYLRSEKGAVLPKGCSRGFMMDHFDYDAKLFLWANEYDYKPKTYIEVLGNVHEHQDLLREQEAE